MRLSPHLLLVLNSNCCSVHSLPFTPYFPWSSATSRPRLLVQRHSNYSHQASCLCSSFLRIAQSLNGSPSFQSNFVLFHFTTICFAILRPTTKTQCHPGVATSASADYCARYRICRRILLSCVIGLVFPLSSFATVSPHYDLHYA